MPQQNQSDSSYYIKVKVKAADLTKAVNRPIKLVAIVATTNIHIHYRLVNHTIDC